MTRGNDEFKEFFAQKTAKTQRVARQRSRRREGTNSCAEHRRRSKPQARLVRVHTQFTPARRVMLWQPALGAAYSVRANARVVSNLAAVCVLIAIRQSVTRG